MELRLEIISFQKSLMGDAQSQTFDETGGSIGRGRDSTWVLPDPNRYVSTRHAEIGFSGGRFHITDTSTNGVFLNGSATAIGRDQRVPLSDGDRLVLGDYEIAVRQEADSRRPEAPRPAKATPAVFERSGEAPPKDILDVIDRRRNEPRLGRLEIPADAFDDPAPPPAAPPRLSAVPPPASRGPIPPPPPRRQAPPARPEPAARVEPTIAPKSTAPSIPDGIDFGPTAATTAPAAPTKAPQPAASPTVLQDDLDAFLPAPPAARPTPRVPPGLGTPPAPASPPTGATRPLLPDDDLDDLLPTPASKPETAGQRPPAVVPPLPEAPMPQPGPAERLLPEGVPLLRPMPGTGNRPQPLSPAAPVERAMPSPGVPPIAAPRDTVPAATAAQSDGMVSALAAGLGVDPRALDGLDPAATVTLVGRAARSAALGIAGALDARNALARIAGLDPSAFDPDDDNPFLVFRSGEAALKQSLSATEPSQTLDAATRQSVATLSANASAAAVALETLLDRFETTNPPQSADEVREIFGTSFLNAYHREISRPR